MKHKSAAFWFWISLILINWGIIVLSAETNDTSTSMFALCVIILSFGKALGEAKKLDSDER